MHTQEKTTSMCSLIGLKGDPRKSPESALVGRSAMVSQAPDRSLGHQGEPGVVSYYQSEIMLYSEIQLKGIECDRCLKYLFKESQRLTQKSLSPINENSSIPLSRYVECCV